MDLCWIRKLNSREVAPPINSLRIQVTTTHPSKFLTNIYITGIQTYTPVLEMCPLIKCLPLAISDPKGCSRLTGLTWGWGVEWSSHFEQFVWIGILISWFIFIIPTKLNRISSPIILKNQGSPFFLLEAAELLCANTSLPSLLWGLHVRDLKNSDRWVFKNHLDRGCWSYCWWFRNFGDHQLIWRIHHYLKVLHI